MSATLSGVSDFVMDPSIFAAAVRVFGDVERASAWLSRPATGLDRMRPIDLMGSAEGRQVVSDFLIRIEYGVYS